MAMSLVWVFWPTLYSDVDAVKMMKMIYLTCCTCCQPLVGK